MFLIWRGIVYHLGESGDSHVLDTRGLDDPNQWVWQVIPRQLFDDVRRQKVAETYRGPG